MGMFDVVYWQAPLPGKPPEKPQADDTTHFQTKSLMSALSTGGGHTYSVTQAGELVHETAEGPKPCEYTGAIRFYTEWVADDDGAQSWWEYVAIFYKGKLENVVEEKE